MDLFVAGASKAVFFNLFFEAEPFEAFLTDHGTHEHSQEFDLKAA